ncbi:MAG: hypothetical protein ACJAZ2_000002 [Glaciecola sp.]|jgi:hypothetical protein
MKKKGRKIAFRSVALLLLFMFFFGVLLFRSSSFQTYLTQEVTEYFSKRTSSKISIGEIEFRWFKKLLIKDFLILDHHEDTLLYAHQLNMKVQDYDFDKREFKLEKLHLKDAYVSLKKYEGEEDYNFKQFIDSLKLKKRKKKNATEIHLETRKLLLENIKFRFWDENKQQKDFGVDYHHLVCTSLNGEIDSLLVINDSINAEIMGLSLLEKSGFELVNLKAKTVVSSTEMTMSNMKLNSSGTELNGKLSFKYKEYLDWRKFIKKVKIQSELIPSQVSGHDLSYFVPALKGIKDSVTIQGKISGKIGRLKLKNFILGFGERSYFKGKVDIDGLPDIKNAFVYINAKELVTNDKDVKNLPLPPFTEDHKIKVPSWFKNLDDVKFKGKYTGFSNDFVAYGTFRTACGTVKSDVKFSKDDISGLVITGGVNTSFFNLKKLLKEKELGTMAFGGDVKVNVKDKKFNFKMKGKLPFIEVHNYNYKGVDVDGTLTNSKFEGDLQVNDTNLVMSFNGGVDFSKQKQEYKFKADVRRANVSNLGLIKRDSSTSVSFTMNIDLAGNTVKDIRGKVDVLDFDWHESGRDYHFNTTSIKSVKLKEKELISLNSDWFVARIEGQYDLQELYPSLINIVARDLPSLVDWKYSKVESKGKNNFRLMFKIKDYALLHDLITPNLWLDRASFSGSFNDKSQIFHMNFSADTIKMNGAKADNFKLYAHNKNEQVNVTVKSKFIGANDSVGIKNVVSTIQSADNLSNYEVTWDNETAVRNSAKITGVMGVEKLDSIWTHINQFDLVVEDNLWEIDSTNTVVFNPGKVNFRHFLVRSGKEYLNIDGLLTSELNNNLKINAKDFKLKNLKRIFDRYNVGIDGKLSGNFKLEGNLKEPVLKSDVEVNEFKLNGQSFGKICLHSQYDTEWGRLGINLNVENQSRFLVGNSIEVSGDYFPKRNGEVDLEAKFSNLKLTFLERYFNGVFSEFKQGKTSGEFDIKGTLKSPELYGKLKLDQMNLKVDYLNVAYAINGEYIHFNNDKILFKEFKLTHNIYTKSKIFVNGTVFHTGFKNITYKMDSIKLKDLFCLNTTIDENSSYYGQAFVDGLLRVEGDGKVNTISGAISTVPYEDKLSKGTTKLNLPLGEVGELEVSDFIHFVDLSKGHDQNKRYAEKLDLSGLSLDFNFLINKEATAKIIFDPKVGDEIEVNGNGNINMNINSQGNFLMSGKYTIDEGRYFFTLKNFIGKKFIVEKGSTLVWDGDPVNATIDIKTRYKARAKLIDLANLSEVNYESNKERYSNRSAVYAGLDIQGELMKPEIKMGVTLPNGTPDEKEFLSNRLVGEDEINRQVFALLLTNQFLPSSVSGFSDAVNMGAGIDNGIQFLEGQLNNSLGGILNNVDLGLDYNSGSTNDSLSHDELRLLLGFQYKKFSVKTDYALNNEAGEIQVEYKITDRLKAKAYRRTTEQVIVSNGVDLTQGAGVVYQKSFDSIKGLFTRKRKKKNEKDNK